MTELKAPLFPESIEEGEVGSWLKKVGDIVEEGEVVVEIETDKSSAEIPAIASGVITKILKNEGDSVLSEEVLAIIEDVSDVKEDSSNEEILENVTSENNDISIVEIKAPLFPESIEEGEIGTWLKKVGDSVEEGEIIVEVETDKSTGEIPSLSSGVLTKIFKNEGDSVLSEEVLAEVTQGQTTTVKENTTVKKEEVKTQKVNESLSPSVRRESKKLNVDTSTVKGTGKNNRILKEDIQKVASSKPTVSNTKNVTVDNINGRVEKRVKMTKIRQTIAKRLVEVQHTNAILTTFNEVDMKPIMDLRKKYKDLFIKTHNSKLGFMSFFVKATTEALKRFPDVNASIDGKDIIYHGFFDIGVAVGTDKGLFVPVIRNTDQKSLAEIETTILEKAVKAKAGKLSMDEMQGGTFTITNGGTYGSMLSTPIINAPQSAILGMHNIVERPVVIDGKVDIRPIMYLALSYDHRIIDGGTSVRFLKTIKELLEDPARILLEI